MIFLPKSPWERCLIRAFALQSAPGGPESAAISPNTASSWKGSWTVSFTKGRCFRKLEWTTKRQVTDPDLCFATPYSFSRYVQKEEIPSIYLVARYVNTWNGEVTQLIIFLTFVMWNNCDCDTENTKKRLTEETSYPKQKSWNLTGVDLKKDVQMEHPTATSLLQKNIQPKRRQELIM